MPLLRHTGLNLLGLGAPLLVATLTIPYLIEQLGVPRFGLLTLVWAISSYFGLFDLGLGRALTQRLAADEARGEQTQAGAIAATAFLLMGALGLLLGMLLAASSDWLVAQLSDRTGADGEVVGALMAMAVALPAIVLTPGFRGVLEARQRFGLVNALRLPMGLYTFLAPAAAVTLGHSGLDTIAWVLAIGRLLFCLLHAFFAQRELGQRLVWRPQPTLVRSLCSYGGWMSVSNVVAPLMGYADRFFLGALVSSAAVAHYATPQELVTKLWIIPGALTAVLLPAFAAQATRQDGQHAVLFQRALALIAVSLLPLTLLLALFAHELLLFWLGAELAAQTSLPLQIFSIGMFINCLATIPYTLIQGAGRAKTSGLIHLLQLPLFLLALYGCTATWGLQGALAAWLLRMVVDTLLMFGFGLPLADLNWRAALRPRALLIGALAVAGFAGLLLPGLAVRAVLLAGICAASFWVLWPLVRGATTSTKAVHA